MASDAPEEKLRDIEAQPLQHHPSPTARCGAALEDRVPVGTKALHLAGYFLCNISLTLYNKLILGKVSTLINDLTFGQQHDG